MVKNHNIFTNADVILKQHINEAKYEKGRKMQMLFYSREATQTAWDSAGVFLGPEVCRRGAASAPQATVGCRAFLGKAWP